MNKEKAASFLKDTADVLTSMERGYFLADGTLLGAIREGDIIPYDKDMDLGVFFEEWAVLDFFLLIHKMYKIYAKPLNIFGDFNNCLEISFARDGIKIDIFFYRKSNDKRIYHAFRNGGRGGRSDVITYSYDDRLFQELEYIPFLGYRYPVPKEAVQVLQAKYGMGWRIPQMEWDWADDPQNKVIHS